MSRHWLAVAVATVALGIGAWVAEAQEAVSSKELARLGFFLDFDELDLESLLTSEETTASVASRREQSLKQAPGVVTVIEETDIRNLGAQTLWDLLRILPGVDVIHDGLGRARIVMRGLVGHATASSEGVLIQIDGTPINEGISGGATTVNLDIPMGKVKRIELLRGPGSALYGAGALAGVINIVTFAPADTTGFSVTAGGGSYGSKRLTLQLGAPVAGVAVAGFVHFHDADGAQLPIAEDAQTLVDRAHPERDPISLAPGRTTDDRRTLESHYRFGYKDFGLDWRMVQETSGGYLGATDSLGLNNDLNNRQMSLVARFGRSVGEVGNLVARVGWSQSQLRELLELMPSGYLLAYEEGQTTLPAVLLQTALNTRRYDAELVLDREIQPTHHLLAGVSVARESTFGLEAQANIDYRELAAFRPPEGEQALEFETLDGIVEDAARNTVSVFVEDTVSVGPSGLAVTGGVRLDRTDDFGAVVSPRLAGVWSPTDRLTLKALYGRGFRAPSFAELHFSLPGLVGDPDLEPTTTDTFDGLLQYRTDTWLFSVGGFASSIHNPILPAATPSIETPQMLINGPGIDLAGLEVEARGSLGDHIGFLSLTALRAREAETGSRAADIPTLCASVGATLSLAEGYSLTPSLLYRSQRPRGADDTRDAVPGHLLVDLTLRGQEVLRRLGVGATIRNLLDEEYFDPSPLYGVPGDYPQPGRSFLVYAEYSF